MAVTRLYLVGSAVPAETLFDKLNARIEPPAAEGAERAMEFYDSFDFRLLAGGFLLRREGRIWELFSCDHPFLPGVVFERDRPPRFAKDFRPGDLRRLLGPLLGVRALVRSSAVTVRETHGVFPPHGPGEPAAAARLSEYRPADAPNGTAIVRVLALSAESASGFRAAPAPDVLVSLGAAALDDFRAPAAVILGSGGRIPGAWAGRFTVPLTGGTGVEEATRRYFSRLAAVMEETRDGISRDIDTEFLHDFRVAVRRLRTWLDIFDPRPDGGGDDPIRAILRRLADSTNALRDYDVLLLRLTGLAKDVGDELKKDVPAWLARIRSLRNSARRETARLFAPGGLDEALAVLRAFAVPKTNDAAAGGPASLGQLAASYLSAAYERFRRRLKKADKRGAGKDLHRLRLAVKKLRYGVEAFGNARPAAGTGPLLDAAKAVQDALGEANDIAVGRLLIAEQAALICRGPADRGLRLAQVNGAVLQLLAAREAKARKNARRELRRLGRRLRKLKSPVFDPAPDGPPQNDNSALMES